MKKSMKRAAALVLALGMAVSMTACSNNDSKSNETTKAPEGGSQGEASYEGAELVVATWGWTAANVKALAADFEAKYGCTVVIDETSGNGDRMNKIMAQKDNPEIDVALLTKSFADIGNSEGLFEKIDTSVVTSLDNLYDFAKNADGYGPCYSLVRYGIMYDADVVKEAPKSYVDLFDDKYAGMVTLPDMTSTAGPYMLMAMAESLGGGEKGLEAAFELMAEKKDNIASWYTASSDVQQGFTTGEVALTVFMDMNMPTLTDSGINVKWIDAEEGSFAAAATVNVVKNCQNPELAQLFVEYMISDEVQSKVAESLSEAPTNMNATMPEEMKAYLAFGADSMDALKSFDEAYISEHKQEWVDRFQREVAVQ
jgi:putative spermidine/putrescine transport system substrate-binding protein